MRDYLGIASENVVIYECYDFHREVVFSSSRRKKISKEEDLLLKKSDIVFVTSKALLKEKSRYHPLVYLMNNAADSVFYAKAQDPRTTIPKEIEKIHRPVIGYLGSLNDFVDIDLLMKVAKRHQECSVLIVGGIDPHHRNKNFEKKVKLFLHLSNVYFVGWQRGKIPNYFRIVNVCIIPYRSDKVFNHYRDPNKLHKYIAMGKPVVSTDILGENPCKKFVKIAGTSDEFMFHIEQAMSEDCEEKAKARLDWAKNNKWDKRSERMIEVIKNRLYKSNSRFE
jgi:glycosyltransferase involved in cell wall biosynthesis